MQTIDGNFRRKKEQQNPNNMNETIAVEEVNQRSKLQINFVLNGIVSASSPLEYKLNNQ